MRIGTAVQHAHAQGARDVRHYGLEGPELHGTRDVRDVQGRAGLVVARYRGGRPRHDGQGEWAPSAASAYSVSDPYIA
jgi:hypothetical protein